MGLRQGLIKGLLGSVTPSEPVRAFGVAFQPHATQPVFCTYSAKTQVTNPMMAGGATATVRLLSDAVNPPTTVRAVVEATTLSAMALPAGLTTSNTAPVSYLVPPGHYVLLTSTLVGVGANSLVVQCEEILE